MVKRSNYGVVLLVALFLSTEPLSSQAWNLEQCIDYAKANNADIHQARLNRQTAQIEYNQKKIDYLPSIGGSVQHNYSSGRVLDPTTYEFIENSNVNDLNAAISLSVNIFSGGSKLYKKRLAEIQLTAEENNILSQENRIALAVISAYYEILFAEDNVDILQKKISALKNQETQIQAKIDAQAATNKDITQVNAEIEKAYGDMAAAKSGLLIAKINMCRLLAMDEEYMHFSVARDDLSAIVPPVGIIDDFALTEYALKNPDVIGARLSMNKSAQQIKLAQAAMLPSISLNAGYGSSFSDARKKLLLDSAGLPTVGADGEVQYTSYPFINQIRDNSKAFISTTLSIPIFNALYHRNNVKAAKIDYARAEAGYDNAILTTKSVLRKAIIDAESAYEKFQRLSASVSLYKESVRYVEIRLEADDATLYEYTMALNDYVVAELELSQAKHEYLMRLRTIDVYAGKF